MSLLSVMRKSNESTGLSRSDARTLLNAIEGADAIVIGAGAGLSTSGGLEYSGRRFKEWFSDFEDAYGFHDMYSGGFFPYQTPEEHWAYWSRYVMCNRYDQPPTKPYTDLLELVRDKDYFVLTTNVDHQFQLAGFDKKRLFYTQGDYGLFQCSKPCCQKTWDNEDAIRAMMDAQRQAKERGEDTMAVPHELLPTCPHCGAPATMNLRADNTFVEDEGWHAASLRFDDFIRRHEGLPTVYLELGVGMNTPAIIKFPFWKMTAKSRKAHYAIVNKGEAFIPDEIIYQSTVIDDDAGSVIEALNNLRKGDINEREDHESRSARA